MFTYRMPAVSIRLSTLYQISIKIGVWKSKWWKKTAMQSNHSILKVTVKHILYYNGASHIEYTQILSLKNKKSNLCKLQIK